MQNIKNNKPYVTSKKIYLRNGNELKKTLENNVQTNMPLGKILSSFL